MPDTAKYFTGDVVNPLVGLQYIQGGLPPNAKLKVTVSRPDTSVGNLLSQEKLGPPVVIDADTIPPRQATLMAIETRTGKPVVGYTQQAFDLFDDVIHTNSPEPAGLFGNPLKDLLTMEGNYTFHFQASYGDTCTATRELLWSLHVDPGIDSSRTTVTTNVSGGTGTITLVPKDKYGNNLGPGRGDGLSITGAPGTIVTGPVRDNGDGSYTVPVSWDPSSGDGPGVVIGQPGRPPVVVHDPKVKGNTGANFSLVHTFPAGILCVAIDPSSSNTVWVGLIDGTIWRTENALAGAASVWNSYSTGLPVGRGATSIAVDPFNSQRVVAGFWGASGVPVPNRSQHVYLTTNKGTNWTDVSGTDGGAANLPDRPIYAVALDPGSSNGLFGIVWSGTRLVAVGLFGTVLTSPDGINYTAQASDAYNTLAAVTWTGTQFVAAGLGGTILTSPDGVAWTLRKASIYLAHNLCYLIDCRDRATSCESNKRRRAYRQEEP